MKRLTTTLLFMALLTTGWGGPIGSWTSYLAYSDITDIAPTGKRVYVLSSKGLFAYNTTDNSVQSFDKMNVLNDCNIAHIEYCKAAKRLFIAYENYNFDLLDDKDDVVNISDYYNKSMTVDKTINNVKVIGKDALIATNFGILKVNVADAEITATYNLGRKVCDAIIYNNIIYAACGEGGIIKGNTNDNLLDKSNWTTEADIRAEHLFELNGQLLAATNGTIYKKIGNEWSVAYEYAFNYCQVTNGQLILVQEHEAMALANVNTPTYIRQNDYTLKAVAYDNTNHCYWSNQDDGKLCSFILDEDNNVTQQITNINPDGPKYNYFGFLKHYNNTLFSCGGGFGAGAELFRKATVQVMKDHQWTNYQDVVEGATYRFEDLVCLDIDPKNHNHVFAGGRTGLYEYLDGKIVNHYNSENSPLGYALDSNSKNYILTLGIKFDKQGNLWCLNSQAIDRSLLCLKTDGTWEDHHKKNLVENKRSLGNMKCMLLDSRGLLWFVNDHWDTPSFYCVDPSNAAMNHYTSFVNEDGTRVETTGVRCVTEDKENNIWVGTSVGPLMLPADDIANGSNSVLQQIKVPRNDGTNFADYLLGGADITCMAVDGGNRKWFGTNGNGAYLISADNMTQVQHFLTSNSQLLSNNIEAIAIDDQTGEVFFGTDNGLCSYMSDASATNDLMDKNNVYAYPNPVKPDYTGLITVTGLTMNANVKIVTASGALVAEGTSNGGIFTWDGCDEEGKRVASGVYMVQTATSDGKKGTVCKIAIVR